MNKYLHVLFFLILNLFFGDSVVGQAPLVKQWDKRYGGNAAENLFSIQQTSDGGIIVGGRSDSGLNGDKTQASWGMSDYWVVKIDALGNKQWDKRYGGTNSDQLFAITQLSNGGYLLCGFSNSGIGGDKTQPSWGGHDYWIIKVDSLGNKIWDKRFGGLFEEQLYSIIVSNDGGFLLAGVSNSGIGGDKSQPTWGDFDYWIVKTDSDGNFQWDKRFGSALEDKLHSVTKTKDGGYVLGGTSYSGIGGDKTQPSQGYSDYWIVKIDSIGNKLWDKRFGGTNIDYMLSIAQTSDYGFILGGYSNSAISGDKTQNAWSNFPDYWIVKIDSLGIKQWDRRFGGTNQELSATVSQTKNGYYLLGGASQSNIGGDKTENNLGSSQTWVVLVDPSGNKVWDKTIFTSGGAEVTGFSFQNNDGCYTFANSTQAGIGGEKTQTSRGSSDYWIIKYCDTAIYSPVASFNCSTPIFCEKSCINFNDISGYNPTSWQWFFPGASPDTSTKQNPTGICYNSYGSFDVKLIACNAAGCDSIIFYNFINEYQDPVDSIYNSNDTLWSLPFSAYQWYLVGSGSIPGATNQYYVPTQLGSYYCVADDSIGCVATSNTIVLTAIQSAIANSQFAIFPNPNDGNFEIVLSEMCNSSFGGKCGLRIINTLGEVVFQSEIQKQKLIIQSSFTDGIYFLELTSNNKTFHRKFIVKQ